MSDSVAAAYGWGDLALGHGFHETAHGVRFTIDEAARREVLSRLLELNHQRYAEEVAAGLHEKRTGKSRGARAVGSESDNTGQMGLFLLSPLTIVLVSMQQILNINSPESFLEYAL